MTRTLLITTFACLVSAAVALTAASAKPNLIQKAFLKAGGGKKLREQVVARYFDGVDKQKCEQIVSCFNPSGTKIRDVCGVSNSERLATPEQLGDRCMEFLAAHPDCKVMFHHPYVDLIFSSLFSVLLDVLLTHSFYFRPTCLRGKSRWVFANWYEEGTWSGKSDGIEPDGSPLDVEGQTRFLVNDDLKITEMVVTRTFSEWEKQLQKKS
jgi:hypothetical protein